MKNINQIISFIILVLLVGACMPEEYSIGDIDIQSSDLVEGTAFTITHDSENPNIIYLKSLMGSEYTPLWNHPQGRSQEQEVTLEIPFSGTYDVQFGVQTRGGYVYGDSVTFTVDDMYAGFISDEVWTMISGGANESKTWYLDLDADATTRFFDGPMWFFTSTYEWDNLHTAGGENYIDADVWNAADAITPNLTDGEATWYWAADYAGNTWMCTAADFGTMTFDLIGGANVTVDQADYSSDLGTKSGTYNLDVDAHTIKFTDVSPLHTTERSSEVEVATEYRILYLTDDCMQILIVPSGTCLNYISEDYRDNYVAEDEADPEPELPDGWQDDISVDVSYSIKWVLSDETPFNWANLDGSLMNDWPTVDDYPSWTGFDSSVPDSYANFSLEMNSQTGEVVYTDVDGNSTTGTYTLDEDGIYTFTDVTPYFLICSDWVYLTTTADNQWRILDIEYDGDEVSGMWVGVLSDDQTQYMCYFLEPEAAGASGGDSSENTGTELTFDTSKMLFGDLEENGNYRIELYNEYGDGTTLADPPFTLTDFSFSSSFEITFTLSGITFNEGAAGSYQSAVSYASADWSTSYWGDGTGDGEVTVTGDGTYTVTCAPGSSGSSAIVFVVDILNMGADITDLTAVTATVDKIVMY